MRVIPVASGKGGVGKTLLAANLSIALAQAGRKVVLADLDLGGSNLHLMLGTRPTGEGLGTFLSGSSVRFADVIVPTDIPNLSFIHGDAEIPGLANVKSGLKNKLIRNLLAVEADYLVLDLGAGTGTNILDFFLMSGQGIVVATPTLAATLNAYLFLKNAVFRLMAVSFPAKTEAREYLDGLRKDAAALQKAYIPSVLDEVKRVDPESYASFREKAKRFEPRIVLNMLANPKDADRAQKIRRSCREYLGLDLEHLGVIYRDELQDAALSSRLPILVYKPQSVLSQGVYRVADKILEAESRPDGGALSEAMVEGGFQDAELEAETDFDVKMESLGDLLHCGALSMGDLVDTVRSQQYEITQLRKESLVLKRKIAEAIQKGYTG
jgi:flagellar biosynthesis protein FlhG